MLRQLTPFLDSGRNLVRRGRSRILKITTVDDVRAVAEVDAAHVVDRQRTHVFAVALHDPLEAVAHPEDVDAVEIAANRRGADDAVDAGRRTAADQDREVVMMFHQSMMAGTRASRNAKKCPPSSGSLHLCRHVRFG